MYQFKKIFAILLSSLVFAFGPFISLAGADWTQFQFNPQHIGTDASETSLNAPLTLQSLYPQFANASIVNSGTTLFVKTNSGVLYSIDANSGTIHWQVQTAAGGEIVYANGTVFNSNFGNSVVAYNASNGQQLWSNSISVTGLTYSNGNLYIGTGNGVAALNATTGSTLWGQGLFAPSFGAPSVDNGKVFAGLYQTNDHSMNAFDANTGAVVWQSPPSSSYGSTSLVANNVVYMADHDNGLDAFDETTGGQLYHDPQRPGAYTDNPLAYADNYIYTSDNNGKVYAFIPATGHIAWTYDSGATNNGAPVVVAHGILYYGNSTKLVALNDQTGALIWQYNTGAVQRILDANNKLYVSSSNGLYVFSNYPTGSTIGVTPSTANEAVGMPFSLTVVANGGGIAFNAAQSTVSVSSNLKIISINAPQSNSCNLQYTQSPSSSNPSFAGAIYGSSATNCNVYTIILQPLSTGTGTVTFTNASMKSYLDNSEIIAGVQNGSYALTQPTPTPTPPGTTLQTIDDSVQGSGLDQWNYVGNWSHCTDTSTPACNPNLYNNSVSWNNTTNNYATITFNGRQVILYGLTDPNHGIAAVSIDGGTETNVDFYSQTRQGDVQLWTSPLLTLGQHTLKVRVTGTKNANSGGTYLALDRADVIQNSPSDIAVTNTVFVTYGPTYTITGTRDTSITHVFANGSESGVTYPTSTTWQAVENVTLGSNSFTIYGKDDNNNQTGSIPVSVNRHNLGDINGDGIVDLTDASLFAVDYGKTDPSTFTYPLSDMNNDGKVDLTDLSILAKLEQ